MKTWIKWGAIALVALLALKGLMGGGDKPDPATDTPAAVDSAAPADAPAATEAPAGVTLAAFEQIQTGASYDEVVALIGPPASTMSESEIAGHKSAMYQWKGAGFASNMTAMFTDGKLVTKAQMGLK